MSYSNKDRDHAILMIGMGKEELAQLSFYEELEKFNWVYIHRQNKEFESIELTYSGLDLFKSLKKDLSPEELSAITLS